MADRMPVQHVVADRHRDDRPAGADLRHAHPERLRRAVALEHPFADLLGDVLRAH